MKTFHLTKAALAGLVGTVAMSLLVYVAPIMGIPMGGPWKMLAMFFKAPIIVGWIVHFLIGAILAVLYAIAFYTWLPGPPAVRGLLYGIFPWFLAMLIVVPLMGGPIFMGAASKAFGSLIGHFVYGVVVGAVYGHGKER